MKRIALILFLIQAMGFSLTALAFDPIVVVNLRCEMLSNPTGIGVTHPRFSWQIESRERGVMQVSYQILVATSLEKLSHDEGDLWNSGVVRSESTVLITYSGKPLVSREVCFWKLKVMTNHGEPAWSEPASFSIGLLQSSDWKAKWIGLDKSFPWDSVSKFARLSARYFRKEFQASQKIQKATLYIAGLGLYEAYINGERIGQQVLSPSPTDYSKTILYNTFDVTSKLNAGKNTLGTVLGNGRFFTMRQHYKPQKWHNFGFPQMICQLELEFADGKKQIIASDESWKVTADGPIRSNNEYDGEEYDATKELTGWNNKGFDDSKWLKVQLLESPGGQLKAQMNEAMKVMERVLPVSVKRLSDSKYIMDMGQNMAGWIRMNVVGKRGDRVQLRFAESLQPNGELYTANLRDALVTDVYTLKGSEKETWCPTFVFHGFRYVELTGFPGTPTVDDFIGEVIYDSINTIGAFETSNDILNHIYKNAYWGIRSNYKGMPIDCPQRNERQPWLGDRTMGSYGESFLFDNSKLYAKWLNDIQDAQRPEGSIPDVAPNFWYYYKDNMTWPGAYLTIAHMLYKQFGDKRSIIIHYPSMKKWMAYMKKKYLTPDFILTKDSYGDWCVPPESPELIHSKDSSRITNPQLIATAYYFYLLQLMQEFASLSNNKGDMPAYAMEAKHVKDGFNKRFFEKTNSYYGNNTVTANILPLAFGMVPDLEKGKVFQHIADKIEKDDNGHISTGVIGTQWLMRWLTKYDRPDIAYQLASNTSYPSWGYMVKNGATTIWELWNGNTANPSMNSQNHVMLLGDLLVWMYENLGGIQSDTNEVGFKRIIMKPSFDVSLTFVNASYKSPYGKIESRWKKSNGFLIWEVNVPANAHAILYIPVGSPDFVKEGTVVASQSPGVQFLRMEKYRAVFQIGSGHYVFAAPSAPIEGVGKN